MKKHFCRECGKEIKIKPIILSNMLSNKEAVEYFRYREGQNASVCEKCWEIFKNSK